MKLTKPAAIWQGKCPCCHQGDIFKYSANSVTRFSIMNETCPVCGTSFEPEPGFYFGALFISYGFTVAIFAILWLVLYTLFRPPLWIYLTAIISACIVFIPTSFRYSRILFLYWFGGIKFKGK